MPPTPQGKGHFSLVNTYFTIVIFENLFDYIYCTLSHQNIAIYEGTLKSRDFIEKYYEANSKIMEFSLHLRRKHTFMGSLCVW